MKRYKCPTCNREVFFESTSCVSCGTGLGLDLAQRHMVAMTLPGGEGSTGSAYRMCSNTAHDACNCIVPPGSLDAFCLSCRHNRTIPDLSVPENVTAWGKLELAKRQLLYSLLRWRLPLPTRIENPQHGLVFDFLADQSLPDGLVEKVLTGHDSGLITVNIAEADDAVRENMRTGMGEPYRTLLGHFRHEIGHYYWDRLVRDAALTGQFRAIFGDESTDYAQALKDHYAAGPDPSWPERFISSYASTHPWEDFAETWAHYIHIVDSLETARAYGMELDAAPAPADAAGTAVAFDPYGNTSLQAILDAWMPFTVALNSINRSMGQRDFYPFVLNEPVRLKLDFMHRLVRGQVS